MTVLDSLMRPLARLMNKNLSSSIRGRELCERLDGRRVAVELRDSPLRVGFAFGNGEVVLSDERTDEADAIVSGSLSGFVRMASGDEAVLRAGDLSIHGDAETASSFREVLACARPDVEEELSNVVGDTAAHQLGEAVRGLIGWSNRARDTMRDNVREYLQEESRALPSRIEIEQFAADTGRLRDDVERLEARLNRLGSR